MFHAKTSQTHDIPTKLRYWIPWAWKGHVAPTKSKYTDSKISAYQRGTWLKTNKYQTVILAYLRYEYANYRTLFTIYYLLAARIYIVSRNYKGLCCFGALFALGARDKVPPLGRPEWYSTLTSTKVHNYQLLQITHDVILLSHYFK
jgi:hypothetical protein